MKSYSDKFSVITSFIPSHTRWFYIDVFQYTAILYSYFTISYFKLDYLNTFLYDGTSVFILFLNYQIHRSWILRIFVIGNGSRDYSHLRNIHVCHGFLRHKMVYILKKYHENGSCVAQKFNLIYWKKRLNIA